MAQRDCLKAALAYARRGWAVFPLDGKRPYPDTHGHNDATTDEAVIRRWWKEYPSANVGIACDSQRGPLVLDIDGESGEVLLQKLDLPSTREATSGKKGRHLYFDPTESGAQIRRTIKLKHEGKKYAFDILGDGGYVVAPPSIHPETGKPYTWTTKSKIVPLPSLVVDLVAKHHDEPTNGNGKKKVSPPLPEVIGEGERDNLLTSLAGSMRRRGASESAILAALREENEVRVDPPLPDKQLRKIARSIAQKEPAEPEHRLTDRGNALRLIDAFGNVIRSTGSAKNPWYIWTGQYWRRDANGEIHRLVKRTIDLLFKEAEQTADIDRRDALLKHATKSEAAGRLKAVADVASTELSVLIDEAAFNTDPWVFNVANGTLDLRTGELRPHRQDDLISKIAPVEYDPEARAPRWKKFLREVMDGDKELIEFLRRAVGYAMTGSTKEECLFFCHGQGGNGKSTFLETIRSMFGEYAQQSDFTTFLSKSGDGPRNDIARMRGARLITAIEVSEKREFDPVILKQLTGGDTIMARRLYEEFFEFKPEHKLFIAGNHKPTISEQTEAIWRRIKLIPFLVKFKEDENRDKELKESLLAELPGILNWAVRGCFAWQQEGLNEPDAVKEFTEAYKNENNQLNDFIVQCCEIEPEAWTSITEIYSEYTNWWTRSTGTTRGCHSSRVLGRMLGEVEGLSAVSENGLRGWKGIAVKHEMNR